MSAFEKFSLPPLPKRAIPDSPEHQYDHFCKILNYASVWAENKEERDKLWAKRVEQLEKEMEIRFEAEQRRHDIIIALEKRLVNAELRCRSLEKQLDDQNSENTSYSPSLDDFKMNEINSKLDIITEKMALIETTFESSILSNPNIEIQTNNNSYAEVAKKNVPKNNAEQVIIVRKALEEEKEHEKRGKNLILENFPQDEFDLGFFMSDLLEFNGLGDEDCSPGKFMKQKNPRKGQTILMELEYKESVEKIIRNFAKFKREHKKYQTINVRRDFTILELELYHSLWKIAIERNNEANLYEWTVRNLQLVKLRNPRKWNRKNGV